MEPVIVWDNAMQLSAADIQLFTYNYQNLVTPDIKQQILTIYKDYANEYIRSVLPLPQEQREEQRHLLEQKRDQNIQAIKEVLSKQWRTIHPEADEEEEEEPEYGTMWNQLSE